MALFSPWGNQQFFDENGDPATGWKIYTYVAGSSTALSTFTTAAGTVAQSNPIILNSLGLPTTGQVWLTSGLSYKLVLTNASDVVKKTADDITGVTGTSSVTQWVASGLTPTYVSATSFTLAGDQTSTFHVGRRLQSTVTAGTTYSTITASAYGTLTTVTVTNTSGVLDSGLSAVNYGLFTSTDNAIPGTGVTTIASAATVDIGSSTNSGVEITGTTTITSFGTDYSGPRFLRFTDALTLTHNATNLNLPGGANIVTVAGDTCTAYPNSASTGWNVVSYPRQATGFRADNNGVNITGIADVTYTLIQLSTERQDTNSEFASGRFTAKKAGVHQFYFQFATVNPTANQPIRAALYVNGGRVLTAFKTLVTTLTETVAVYGEINLAVGDFVDPYVYHGRGTAESINGSTELTYFCGGHKGA